MKVKLQGVSRLNCSCKCRLNESCFGFIFLGNVINLGLIYHSNLHALFVVMTSSSLLFS